MKMLRSTIFYIGMYSSILVCFPFVIIGYFLPGTKGFTGASLWARFIRWWLRVTCNLSVHVSGLENIDENERYIFMPNHQSEWETIVTQTVLPPFVFVLKKELFHIPIFGWGLRLSRAIGIDRSKGREALRHIGAESEKAFERGYSIMIFPEGTRQPYGHLGTFLPGGAWLAHRSGKSVIPIAHDAGRFWPKNSFVKQPGIVELRIGNPIDSSGKTTRQIQDESASAIQTLIDEIARDTGQQTLLD